MIISAVLTLIVCGVAAHFTKLFIVGRKRLALTKHIPRNTALERKKVCFGLFEIDVYPFGSDKYGFMKRVYQGNLDAEGNSTVPGLTWFLPVPWYPIFVVSSPEVAETLWRSTTHLNKGGQFEMVVNSMTAHHKPLIVLNNDDWKVRRRLLNKSFHSDLMSEYFEIFNRQCQNMVNHLKNESKTDKNIKWRKYAYSIALELAAETLFGQCLNVLDTNHGIGEITRFEKVFKDLMPHFLKRLHPLFKTGWVYAVFHPIDAWHMRRKIKEFRVMLKSLIENRRAILKKESENTDSSQGQLLGQKLCIIDALLLDPSVGPELEISEIHQFFFAGYDTSSSVMGDGLAYLTAEEGKPYLEKLREEIDSVFPEENFFVTLESLNSMPYLDAVVKELLRLCNPVPIHGRRLSKNWKIPTKTDFLEINLENDCQMDALVIIGGMCRDEKYWGKDAAEFNPDRWERDDLNMRAFAPFSNGPRNCIGKHLALCTMKTEFIYLIKNFEMKCSENRLNSKDLEAELMIKFKDEPAIEFTVK